jgi:hypothetical protein
VRSSSRRRALFVFPYGGGGCGVENNFQKLPLLRFLITGISARSSNPLELFHRIGTKKAENYS